MLDIITFTMLGLIFCGWMYFLWLVNRYRFSDNAVNTRKLVSLATALATFTLCGCIIVAGIAVSQIV